MVLTHSASGMNTAIHVKICGITSVTDAKMAVSAGADAIGLVFYEPSPRYISVDDAINIAQAVGPFVTVVGLFVDAPVAYVNRIIESVSLGLLQFHGDETPKYCGQFALPYMKALRMREGLDVTTAAGEYHDASAILLDAYRKGVPGGTGESFDWQRVPQNLSQHVVLAGGLKPDNAAAAIKQVQPYALDVSGGVESSPGRKDAQKVTEFIANARQANSL